MAKEMATVITICEGEVGVTLGALYQYYTVPCNCTVVYVTAAPSVDDADLTVDINDDGTAAISAISCAVKATPGTWKSTSMGGTNDPVDVAAGSVLSLDANSAASGTRLMVSIWLELGTVWS